MSKAKTLWDAALKIIDKELPTILSGLAVVGLGVSVATAIKETPKATMAMDLAKNEKVMHMTEEELESVGGRVVPDDEDEDVDEEEQTDAINHVVRTQLLRDRDVLVEYHPSNVKLTFWEGFRTLAPVYWPCALSTLATAGCIIASNVVAKRRYLALAAILAAKEKELKEYTAKVKELFGEKKANEVRKEISKDKVMDCPEEIARQYVPGERYPMCFCGHWFTSTKPAVESAFNRWNRRALDDAMRYGQDEVELHMEDLICDLGLNIPDPWLYNRISWIVRLGDASSDGAVGVTFDLGETADGVPGYIVSPSRKPTNYS